jgi:DNA polymerase delta subunit 3
VCDLPHVHLDDAEVIRAHRSPTAEKKPPTRETSPEPTADEGEDVDMQDISMEEEPIRKRSRKTREEWPIGRNGLRKRRIEKERMSTVDNGYIGK